MKKWMLTGTLVALALGWWLSQRVPPVTADGGPSTSPPKTETAAPPSADPGMVRTLPNPDPGMVKTLPNPDPGMVISPPWPPKEPALEPNEEGRRG